MTRKARLMAKGRGIDEGRAIEPVPWNGNPETVMKKRGE